MVVQTEQEELQRLFSDLRLAVEASLCRLANATVEAPQDVSTLKDFTMDSVPEHTYDFGTLASSPTLQPLVVESNDPIPENPFQEAYVDRRVSTTSGASNASAMSMSVASEHLLTFEEKLEQLQKQTSPPTPLSDANPESLLSVADRTPSQKKGTLAVDIFLQEPQLQGWERWKQCLKSSIDYIAAILVLLNSIVLMLELEFKGNAIGAKMGISSGPSLDEIEPIFQGLDRFFVFIFLAELLIRIMVEQREFLREWTNYLDAALVILGLVDFGFSLQVSDGDVVPKDIVLLRLMRALKSLRAIRMMRSFRLFRGLRLLVKACQCFLPSLCWAMVLLGVFMTMGALIMGNLLQSFVTDESATFEDREWIWMRYGTAYRATYTLYEITFAGNWPTNARPVMEKVSHLFVIFFVLYVTVIAFAVIRVISAVFLKDTLDAAQNDAEHLVVDRLRKKAEYVEKLEHIFRAIDDSGDGIITEARMNEILSNDKIAAYFQTLDLDVHEGAALFHLLDNGDGEVTLDEFIDGIMRCKGPARAIDQVAMHADLKQLDNKLVKLAKLLKSSDVITTKSLGRGKEKSKRNSVGARSAHLRAFRPDPSTAPRLSPTGQMKS